jgi:hypothetical protein
MSEALQFFLDNNQVKEAFMAPDEALDYIHILEVEDWKVILDQWDARDDEWKEAITYFAGFVNLKSSMKVLLRAINEKQKDVIDQGLLSIHQSITESDSDPDFTTVETKMIKSLLKTRINDEFPEYEELLKML